MPTLVAFSSDDNNRSPHSVSHRKGGVHTSGKVGVMKPATLLWQTRSPRGVKKTSRSRISRDVHFMRDVKYRIARL
jgi:hypothetical protein